MTTPEIARALLVLFDGGKRWTQHTNALSNSGMSVPISSPLACRYCLVGGTFLIDGNSSECEYFFSQFRKSARLGVWMGVSAWNDASERTYSEVEAVLQVLAKEAS